jgi:transposase
MPYHHSILNLPGFSILKQTGVHRPLLEVLYRGKVCCIYCNSKDLRKKDRFERLVRHESIGLRQVTLKLAGYKYECRSCKRYFRQRFPGLLPYKRSTEALRHEVFTMHCKGVSQADLSSQYHFSPATVERWFQDYYVRQNSKIKQRHCPRVLGIDEHSFSRKTGYATTFCDLSKHRVFDVVKGRSAAELHDYLMSLPGREKVRVVCMDMSVTYRSLIRKYFPNAKIVADRFHVIRLIGHMFLKTCQQIDPATKHQRGILRVLRKKPDNLTDTEKLRLASYLAKHPAIRALYDFKQELHRLLCMKRQSKEQVRQLIPELLQKIEALKTSGFMAMRTLGNTIDDWLEEIGRMWRFSRNNGITEGFHRKMKLIQRRAYGFRNFENYRLRVRILCG